jgi:chromosome transmission fidelity protein 1
VICVPYVSLLDSSMREANGIDIRNSIILFDESHNILESMRDAHSASVSLRDILQSYIQLHKYYDSYCRMLNPKNALHIQTIKNLCFDLMKFMS